MENDLWLEVEDVTTKDKLKIKFKAIKAIQIMPDFNRAVIYTSKFMFEVYRNPEIDSIFHLK